MDGFEWMVCCISNKGADISCPSDWLACLLAVARVADEVVALVVVWVVVDLGVRGGLSPFRPLPRGMSADTRFDKFMALLP